MADAQVSDSPGVRFHLGRGTVVDCALSYDRALRLWTRAFRRREFFYARPGLLLNPCSVVMMSEQR